MLELHRLHRFFGPTKAVNDVSFQVFEGEVVGFIGPNGAGKTTSMRILATLDVPTFGDARIDGFSVVNDPDRVRSRLGFMPDYFGTYPNVNCYEYLDFFARAYGLAGRDRHRAIRYVMGFTKLDELAHKPISGLSKGMKQRLCLGRSLVHDPAVLVLDEPAAGLDPRARIELRQMIRELSSLGKAVLVSSHILTELAEICDRVAVIEKGELLATGTVDDFQTRMTGTDESNEFRLVAIRVLERGTELAQWLDQRDGTQDVTEDGNLIRFRHQGGQEQEAEILKELIHANFAVSEFGQQRQSLEDAYMQLTKGRVQ